LPGVDGPFTSLLVSGLSTVLQFKRQKNPE